MINVFRKNSLILQGARFLKHVICLRIVYDVKKIKRIITKHNEYSDILKYKNKYIGERCFILATGPSLTVEDVSKLKNEITFGMNSICLMFGQLGWETTFYGVQDLAVFLKLKDYYRSFNSTTLFLGDGIPKEDRSGIKHIPYALDYLNHRYSYDTLSTKFSFDVYLHLFDGYTITYSLIQIAAYMGFKEIYLLGNDCSYSTDPKKQHFADFGHYDASTLTARDRILFAYQYAFDFLKDTDVKIYNATRGGELEIFPRVDLDEVLSTE